MPDSPDILAVKMRHCSAYCFNIALCEFIMDWKSMRMRLPLEVHPM